VPVHFAALGKLAAMAWQAGLPDPILFSRRVGSKFKQSLRLLRSGKPGWRRDNNQKPERPVNAYYGANKI